MKWKNYNAYWDSDYLEADFRCSYQDIILEFVMSTEENYEELQTRQ
jgi:hypothetical protein